LSKAPLFPLEDGQTVLAQPTQRWAALLLSMKKWLTNSKKNNVVLNFERKVRKTIIIGIYIDSYNIQSELIDKSIVISTRRWTNGLGTAHSKMGGPTFVNEEVVHKLEKK